AIAEAAADAQHAARQGGIGDTPARLVHFVNALVADVAVAEIPEPVPVVVDQVAGKWPLGGGPQPDVVIEFRRRRLVTVYRQPAARLVAERPRDLELAQLTRANDSDDLRPVGAGAVLRAVLHDTVVHPRHVGRHAALVYLVAARFLNIHVLA